MAKDIARKIETALKVIASAVGRKLRALHGSKTRVVSCGPAGERRSRIAVIQTETGNAAGQGGFGAVMGAKKLKAITVIASGQVPVALVDIVVDHRHEAHAAEYGQALIEPLDLKGTGRRRNADPEMVRQIERFSAGDISSRSPA